MLGLLLGEAAEAAETLVEARDLAARVEHVTTAAGPRRVRQRIDVEQQHIVECVS